jgi:hypothetical protein
MRLNGFSGRHSAACHSTGGVRRPLLRLGPLSWALGLAALGLGCHGRGGLTHDGAAPGDDGRASSADVATGHAGQSGASGAGGVDGGALAGNGGATDGPPHGSDPGFVGVRRLSDAEYTRTVQDLLGLPGLGGGLAISFAQSPDPATGFHDYDNLAGRAAISAARYEAYFTNAVTLVEQAFASQTLRARIQTCVPASATDDACARDIVSAFGLRAWRRPLTPAEVSDLVALVRRDLTAGDAFPDAIQVALVAMLSSESFLYRLEVDPPAAGARPHALTSYELASRLSYLVWSTMPDDALWALAASDELQKPEVLAAQARRLLADARADGLVRNFFGQWLRFRELESAPLGRTTPGWSMAWQRSMADEARLFVDDLVRTTATFRDLLTTDINFVDGNLAKIYALPPPATPDALAQMSLLADGRKGYLGLAAFLTQTSAPTRTAPSVRGRWIDEMLLCQPVPDPPAGVPAAPTPGLTPRQQMEERLGMAGCGTCHKRFEPLGIGLETFDEIGSLRFAYPSAPGVFIDPTGALPDGTPYDGLLGLADQLGKDPRVTACARRELLVYALGRPLSEGDANDILALDARWTSGIMRDLIGAIVVDDLFRTRRAEAQP